MMESSEDMYYNEELDSSSGCDMSFEYSSDNLHVSSPPLAKPKLLITTPKSQLPRRLLDLSPKKKHSLSKMMTLSLSPQETDNEILKDMTPHKNPSLSPPYKRVIALKLFDSPLTPKTILAKSANTSLPRHCLFQNGEKPKAVATSYENKPAANVNPFTPNSM